MKDLICTVSIIIISFNFCFSQDNAGNTSASTYLDDRDGREIKWINIGNQIWMAENLNYTTPSGCWCYENKTAYCDIYGKLYTWETAQNVCPQGWHLPDETDVVRLIDFLGGSELAGAKMKEKGTRHWARPNTSATNTSGFTALPGGNMNKGKSDYIRYLSSWWMAGEKNKNSGKSFVISYDTGDLFIVSNNKQAALSVRCLKD